MDKTLIEAAADVIDAYYDIDCYIDKKAIHALTVARDAAIAQQAEPVAHVPVHPRNGPLWSMTTATPDPERLPEHYPLMPLYATQQPPATSGMPDERAKPDPWRRLDCPACGGTYYCDATVHNAEIYAAGRRQGLEEAKAACEQLWARAGNADECADAIDAPLQTRGKSDSEAG